MCMHAKVKKVRRQAKELRLLQRADMSLLSRCLRCIRTGTDSRYVTADAVSSGNLMLVWCSCRWEGCCRLVGSELRLRRRHGNAGPELLNIAQCEFSPSHQVGRSGVDRMVSTLMVFPSFIVD